LRMNPAMTRLRDCCHFVATWHANPMRRDARREAGPAARASVDSSTNVISDAGKPSAISPSTRRSRAHFFPSSVSVCVRCCGRGARTYGAAEGLPGRPASAAAGSRAFTFAVISGRYMVVANPRYGRGCGCVRPAGTARCAALQIAAHSSLGGAFSCRMVITL
jgi:hypothetical protein